MFFTKSKKSVSPITCSVANCLDNRFISGLCFAHYTERLTPVSADYKCGIAICERPKVSVEAFCDRHLEQGVPACFDCCAGAVPCACD